MKITKKFIQSRRTKPGRKPKAKPSAMRIRTNREKQDPWEKLLQEIEAEEAAAKNVQPKSAEQLGPKPRKKKGNRKPADINSAVKKIFKDDASSTSKKVKKGEGQRLTKSARSASIDYGATLKACKTVPKAAGFVRKTQQRFTSKAQGAVRRRTISDKSRTMLEGLLTKPEATSVCIMTNPRLASDAFEHLHKALVDISQSDPPVDMAFVTLIAGDCETSSDRPVINLHHAQKRAKATLKAMGSNYIAVTEFTMFNSIPHADGGITMNHHEHAFIFGDLQKATYVANRERKKYPDNSTGAHPIDIKPITDLSEENLARIAAYMLKAPDKAINYCPPAEGKKAFVNKSEKSDRMIRFLRMAQIRSMMTFEDCFYAGGDGSKIKTAIFKLLRALSKSDASPQRMLIHPDAIPTFWNDLTKELGRDQWALPVIKRRP